MLLVVPTNIKKHQEGLCFNLLQVISFNKVKEISLPNTHHVVPKVHSIIILSDGSMKFLIFMRYESFGIRYGEENLGRKASLSGKTVPWQSAGLSCWQHNKKREKNVFASSTNK